MTSYVWVAVVALGLALSAPTARGFRGRGSQGHRKAATSRRDQNIRVMLDIFRAIEERDPNHENVQREMAPIQPDVEFHWPPALPYGGVFRGAIRRGGASWESTWTPLQPTAADRKMGPRVIGADETQVAILYHQRGVSPAGERFDGEVLGLYQLRDYKLARAQMFYFDEAAACRFLERASRPQ